MTKEDEKSTRMVYPVCSFILEKVVFLLEMDFLYPILFHTMFKFSRFPGSRKLHKWNKESD